MWEARLDDNRNTGELVIARNTESRRPSSRRWHLVKRSYLRSVGLEIERYSGDSWEVDWSHPESNGTYVMARNLGSHASRAREWHLVSTGYLRTRGVNTPTYRADSWEVDWSKRNGKLVWARNRASKFASARKWHWVDYKTLSRQGIKWKPVREKTGRYVSGDGYVMLSRCGMTDDDIALVEKHGLFIGGGKRITEHRLVALKKYGAIPEDMVVRHVNGIKTDNRPENLVLGTTQDNTLDHDSARVLVMVLREKLREAGVAA